MPARVFHFGGLPEADLVIDAVYEGGTSGNVGADPIARLLPVGNQGGFRYQSNRRLVVLFSSFNDPDWPDTLNIETRAIHIFGDNKTPGHQLHETTRKGNALLRDCFEMIDRAPPHRDEAPPSSCSHALRRPVRLKQLLEGAEKARVFGHVAENPSVFCYFGLFGPNRAPKGWSVRSVASQPQGGRR